MLGLDYGTHVAGGTFPAEIWGTYMKEAKGSFCGGFKPPKTPFQSSPFYGEYSTTGGGSGEDIDGDGTEGFAPLPTEPTEEPEADEPEDTGGGDAPNGGNGGDGDSEGFDPDAYEAPPQPSPETGDGGGTQAPG